MRSPALHPKLGRNELCYCGSGKKYKKCCLGSEPGPDTATNNNYPEDSFLEAAEIQSTGDGPQEVILHTATGEPFMPARLYFKIHNKKHLLQSLSKLRCINKNDKGFFELHYWEEAKK